MAIKIKRQPIRLNHDSEMFVIITERDCASIFNSDGAIIHEQYTKNANIDNILERAKSLNRYGKTYIARLEVIGEAEEIEVTD